MHGIYVGRVGALAVALGVGTAILGLASAAAADTGSDSATGVAGQEPSRSSNSPSRSRADNRRGVGTPSSTTPAPSTAVAGRRAVAPRVGQVTGAAPTATGGATAGTGQLSATDLIGALLTPGGMQNLVQQALVSLISDMVTAVPAEALAPGATVTPEITSVPSADLGAVPAPPVMTAAPSAVSATSSTAVTTLGGGSGDAPLAGTLAWAAVAASRQDPATATPEVAPAATVTTAAPTDPAAAGDVAATSYQPFPDLPSKPGLPLSPTAQLNDAEYLVVNQLAKNFAAAFHLGDITQKCAFGKGCPLEGEPPAVSVSNTVGMYGFNVVYALVAGTTNDAEVAKTVQQLASQPVILDFIAQRVASQFSGLPPAVANLIGAAAKTFVSNTFGSTAGPAGQPNYVDLAFVPFLRALNLPTKAAGFDKFLAALKNDAFAAILNKFSPDDGQKALIGFFSNSDVQGYFGSAFASSIDVLLVPTMANALGEKAATQILGAGNSNIPTLSATIGNAVSGLFSSIGGVVATQGGSAFATFLKQPNVPTYLANNAVNGFLNFLGGTPKFPAADGADFAPAADVAVTGFTQSLLTNPTVPPALGTFVNTLIPGMLTNPGFDQVLGDMAANAVIALFPEGDPLAKPVADQVGIAVANLMAVPVVQTAFTSWVNALGASIINSPQAVTALANAAGGLVSVDLTYGKDPSAAKSEAQKAIIDSLKKNVAIDTAVGQSVTAGVTALFGNSEVLTAVNNAAVSLVTGLLGDTAVQTALSQQVNAEVSKAFGDSAIGQAVGAQVGAAVVGLLNNSATRTALVGLVDTMIGDFFKYPGVVTAVAKAAGEVAAADLAGNDAAAKAAMEQLKASTAVQSAVGNAVGKAVKTFLTDPNLLDALDHAASSLVSGLLTDQNVENAVSATVAKDVSQLLGGGALGDAVGAQVGNTVAGLLSQQAVRTALAGLVDTELGDFFRYDGVVDAFVVAANTYTLDVLGGGDPKAAAKAAEDSLRASTAVQDAAGAIVAKSVKELLDDTTLWSTLDTAAANLLGGLLANPSVQAGVSERVYTSVWTALNGTTFAAAVADQVSTAVVDLMKNPDISKGLVGVVDTVLTDFFGTPGVVTAFSDAAGELASAAVAGTLSTVEPQVQAELRANTDVLRGVNKAVGDAVTALLSNQSVVSALNDKLASLMSDLLGDPDVQAGLDEGVAKSASDLLGGGAFGDAVGAQVGIAVVEILSNPTVKDALEGLVDTELGEFFNAEGVVAAFASAADTFALEVLTGAKVNVAASDAVSQLRTSSAVDTAVQQIVTKTVAELLGNQNVWQAVDGTTSRLVADLLADPDVQQAVAGKVYAAVWVAFNGTALGQVVGDKLAAAVVSLMQNPDVAVGLVGLVDTMTADFFGYQGVVTAFSTAAGELAAAEIAGTIKTVAPEVQAQLRANTDVEQAAGVAVGDAVETLLTDDKVLSALDKTAAGVVTDLLADPTVQAKLNEQIVKDVSKALGGGDLGQAVGTQVAATVDTFLSNPSVRAALVGLVDDELGNFFRSPGVVSAFSAAADMFTVEVVTGENVKTAADDAITWLRNSAPVQDAVVGVITESVGALLSNANVIQAADNGLTTLLTNLGPYAGQLVTVLVTESLKNSPIAVPVGQALGTAVDQLLTVPGFGPVVVTIIASAVPDFLEQFGVPEAIAGVVGDYAAALVAGEDPTVARQNAEEALRTNPTIDSAAKTTIADSLTLVNLNLLSNPAIQQALGATVTTMIITLAADPAVQTFIAQQDGPAVAELLANTAVVGEIATAVGSVVTQLLGYPGFNTALVGAINQYADDVIDGAEMSTAQASALKTLQSAPATVAAVNYVVPPTVSSLLGYPNVRQALGLYADEATINSLEKAPFNIRFLDKIVGQVANGTVESLLTKTAGVTLADNLVVSIMLGMPAKDWRGFTTQEIIADPFLQVAFGMSLGQGVGSLFGDNVVADAIGVAVGIPAVLAVVIGSGIAGILQWLFGRPTYGVTPPASATQALAGEGHRARADLYATNRVMLIPA